MDADIGAGAPPAPRDEVLEGSLNMQLKPIGEQVVVVFGASSGIGRETALQFARRGAKAVVAARGEEGLNSLVQ
jgi:NADPH:quinone reductase-like Zn-dependent oxidoreductase